MPSKPTQALALELAQLDGHIQGRTDARMLIAEWPLNRFSSPEARSELVQALDALISDMRRKYVRLEEQGR